jgi:hypothetical protein
MLNAARFVIPVNTQRYLPKVHQGYSERTSQSQKPNQLTQPPLAKIIDRFTLAILRVNISEFHQGAVLLRPGSIYIWIENSSPKSEGKMAKIEELLEVCSSPFLLFLSARLTQNWQGVCRNIVF